MRKKVFLITFFVLFTKSFYALADDTCNCKDLLQRIELLESIIYQNTDNTLDTITPNSLPTSTTTPELGIQFVNIGDKTVLDFAEFSLDNIKWTDTLEPSDTSGYYSYYGDKEDEKYVSIWGTIKNLSGEKIYIDEMEIEFKFNGKYSYSGSIILEDNDKKGFTSSFCSVKPLSQSRIIIYTSVPDEIMSIYEQGDLTFGFKDDFSSLSYMDKLLDLPYVYKLEFRK